ncbi:50S ribosomal protein L37Ae, partial [Candidatus Micrarchaeota archaeon]|nr:50S ribosomal protein L37Ae [Candidatus Micrarchaeota archaeon]
MAKTKKVLSTGRFGVRYGVGIRKRLLKIELKQRKKHVCSICGFGKLKRTSTGIYYCKKCDKDFSGGAYLPETMTGRIIKKMVIQKKFLPQLGELIEAREKPFEAEKV